MIRKGRLADIPVILDIGDQAVAMVAVDQTPVNRQKASGLLRKAVNHALMDLFVAEVDGKVVGFVVAMVNDQWYNDDKYVTDLAFCTAKGHEDQAVWLFRRLYRWSRERGLPMLMATNAGGDRAERTGAMYEAHGLTRVGGMFHLGAKQ